MDLLSFAFGIFLLLLIAANNSRWIYILHKTLLRDLKALYLFTKLMIELFIWEKREETIPKLFTKLANRVPNKIMVQCENDKWTYREMEEFSNKVAHYFKSLGYAKGDAVALLMENRPEFVGIWLGLAKIGVVTALQNTNLVSDPLEHSITVAKCKGLIFGSTFSNVISELSNKIKALDLFQFGDKEHILQGASEMETALEGQSISSPAEDLANTKCRDKIVYIYTSGTTGLPKAAVISNNRFLFMVAALHVMTGINEDDVFYNPLPLYHSSGGMIAVGQALIYGVTIVTRKKFSVTNYWSDCKKYNCTISNYIGEMCRYLLSVHNPDQPVEHGIKKMTGNGLRPQIWKKFQDTFKIEHIYEFYGSTEGNSNLINIDNTVGAVGFLPRYARLLYPATLIKCNENTGELIKNKEGFYIRCNINEPGVLIGKIYKKQAHRQFTGYADEEATKKKILNNVFTKGDSYFVSGDVLVQDEFGYYYFKDRTGDTFRWKGENVSTCEVEAVISSLLSLNDSIVYGVQIHGTEGKAGMAAIVDPHGTLNVDSLAKGLKAKLPSYAIPMFLRIIDSVPLTGTFKLKKVDLQKEGFDINLVTDHRLYYYNPKEATYIPLTKDVYNDIISGNVKL